MSKTLYDRYYSEIQSWNWSGIVTEARSNPVDPMFDDCDPYGIKFLGTVFGLYPSGKFYTPYANSNVSRIEAYRDEQFTAALESIAGEYGGWIESGEGDPCDIFFGIAIEG